jgi:hypothetical protein
MQLAVFSSSTPFLSEYFLSLLSFCLILTQLGRLPSDWMMSDLRHAMRTPGLTFRSLNMSLFGNRLLEIGAIEETIYHWETDAARLGDYVYVAGFQHITEMLPGGRAEVTSISWRPPST